MGKFIVLGAGTFGGKVAETLIRKGHEVVVVDRDKEAIRDMQDRCSDALVGDASDKESLEALAVADADAVIVSLGAGMEHSILATHHLKTLKAKRIIVKMLNEDHGRILGAVGATDTVFPERDSAITLAMQLDAPNLLHYLPLTAGYRVEEMAPPDEFVGKTISQLDLRRSFGVQIVALHDLIPDRVHVVPDPDVVIRDDQTMIVIGKNEDLDRLKESVKKG